MFVTHGGVVVMRRRRYLWVLALVALLGASTGACVTAAVDHAEALAVKVESLLGATPAPGKWGADSKAVLTALCLRLNENKFRAEEMCECLVVESEKRIDEQAFQEWVLSGGEARADEVVPLGNEAEKVCHDRLGSI